MVYLPTRSRLPVLRSGSWPCRSCGSATTCRRWPRSSANRLCDGLDGALPQRAGATDRGAFLDIALDFFFYGAVPFGFGLADPQSNALPAALLLLQVTSAPARVFCQPRFALRAPRHWGGQDFPRKGLAYIGGLAEGGETIAVFAAMCLWPSWFPGLAYAFAALCLVTAAGRDGCRRSGALETERPPDRIFPPFIFPRPDRGVHPRHEPPVEPPGFCELFRRRMVAGLEACEISRSKGRGLQYLRPVDRGGEHVGQELHGPVGRRHAAVDPEHRRGILRAARQSPCMASRRSRGW